MKRPAVIIGTPFYNWGRDYYAVGEDHVNDFKKQPIRSKLYHLDDSLAPPFQCPFRGFYLLALLLLGPPNLI